MRLFARRFLRKGPDTVFMAQTHSLEREASAYRRPSLSAREVQVMLAWFASDSKTDAAAQVHISVGTINTHLTRIRHKYATVGRPAPTKAALFARALQDGHTTIDNW